MGRQRPVEKLLPLLLAVGLLPCCGCAPRDRARSDALEALSHLPATESVPVQRVTTLQHDLSDSEGRVRQLEQQLAERDREIAAVRGEITAGGGPATVGTAIPPNTGSPGSPATPSAAPVAQNPTGAGPQNPGDGARPEPRARPPQAAAAGMSDPSLPAPDGAATSAASHSATGAPDARLALAEKRIVKLQQQLASELKRRREVEAEMHRLLQETSAGPFERADNVVEEHLREQLDRAQREIGELRATLRSERRERDEFERRYAALQAQMQAQAKVIAAPAAATSNEELEALKERQRRVLASIRQDLESSQQRERELRQSLEHSQGPEGVSLADSVTTLRSENSALQLRLDDEHRRNRDLSAKLQLATRVTDLIFKIQTAGAQPMPVVPLPVAAP